jgi:hypothetical protein
VPGHPGPGDGDAAGDPEGDAGLTLAGVHARPGYVVGVDRRVCLLSLLLCAAGCGDTPAEDRTPALIRCFERHGGERVSRLAQLDRVPSADPQYGTGFSLDSIAFDSLDVDTGAGEARQALVFVERPDSTWTRPSAAAEQLRRARRGDLASVAMIVMPAAADFDDPLGSCAEEVAGDQIYP